MVGVYPLYISINRDITHKKLCKFQKEYKDNSEVKSCVRDTLKVYEYPNATEILLAYINCTKDK